MKIESNKLSILNISEPHAFRKSGPHALGLNRFTELTGLSQAFYESPDFGESGEQFWKWERNFSLFRELQLLRTLFYNQTGLRPKDIIFFPNDFQSLKFGLRTKNASF